MAKGFVAGFVKREGKWIGHWVRMDEAGRTRRSSYDAACRELAQHLGAWCGGEAVARRKMVVVDGLCPDGRELLETIFEVLREQPETDPPQVARREDPLPDQERRP